MASILYFSTSTPCGGSAFDFDFHIKCGDIITKDMPFSYQKYQDRIENIRSSKSYLYTKFGVSSIHQHLTAPSPSLLGLKKLL